MRIQKLIIAAIITFLSITCLSQDKQSYIAQKSKGIILGYGILNESMPGNYNYQISQIIYNYSIPLLNKKRDRIHNLLIHFEPQINPVFLSKNEIEFETGINVGLIYNLKLDDNVLLDVGVGTGPHFLSFDSNKQSNGFIFANNFILGISRRFTGKQNDWEIILQARFRHISNLNITIPNAGIDNLIIYCGISKLF